MVLIIIGAMVLFVVFEQGIDYVHSQLVAHLRRFFATGYFALGLIVGVVLGLRKRLTTGNRNQTTSP